MGFSRQEYWSGLPFPSPGDLPDPGIEPRSPALEADALTSEPPGKPSLRGCTERNTEASVWGSCSRYITWTYSRGNSRSIQTGGCSKNNESVTFKSVRVMKVEESLGTVHDCENMTSHWNARFWTGSFGCKQCYSSSLQNLSSMERLGGSNASVFLSWSQRSYLADVAEYLGL